MRRICLIAALMGAVISARAWNNAADAKLPQYQRRIVMMGNSITDYWMNHDVNNHREFFADNGALCRGVAGQKTPAMVDRFKADVVDLKPLVTVIAGGVNDINGGATPNEVYQNTLKMVNMATAAGIKPILATINPSGWGKSTVDKYRQYNALIKKFCDDHGYGYANYYDALVMSTTDYNEMKPEYRGRTDHSDHLHPSRAGYLVMESVLIPLIEQALWQDGVYKADHAARRDGAYHFGYTAQYGGAYKLYLRYHTTENRHIDVKVNGRTIPSATPTMGVSSHTILLHEGFNELSVTEADGVTFTDFELEAAPGQERVALGSYFPKFSIMGDSYSTYKGWIDAGVDFGGGGYEYPQDKYDLTSVNDTWWKQLESLTGIQLEQNNSISGTCMSYISLNGKGETKTVSFANRVTKMRKADLFIIEGGTNDFSGGRTTYSNATDASINGKKIVGDYKWDGFEADMPDYRFVRPTVAYLIYYLQYKYPGCTIVFMANNSIPEEGRKSFKVICDHYGAIYYEMHDIEKTSGHPVKAGMKAIADQLCDVLLNSVLEGHQPATEQPQYYLYNVGQQKYLKTGGFNKQPDTPELVGSQQEATIQYVTRQSDGTYLIADPDWRKGWGVLGRQTVSISINGNEKTANWGSNFTPGWEFRSADDQGHVFITYTWGDYTAGTYPVDDPTGQTYALYYGDYEQPTDLWSRAGRIDVKNPAVFGGLLSTIAKHGNDALWQIIPVKGVMPDVLPYEPTAIHSQATAPADSPSAQLYNLQGQRVSSNARGLLIADGKKIIR